MKDFEYCSSIIFGTQSIVATMYNLRSGSGAHRQILKDQLMFIDKLMSITINSKVHSLTVCSESLR